MPPGKPAAAGAFADLSDWPKTAVAGPGVIKWLEGLLGVSLASLAPGRAVHGMVRLSPDGADLFLLPEDRARVVERLRARFRLLRKAEALALA